MTTSEPPLPALIRSVTGTADPRIAHVAALAGGMVRRGPTGLLPRQRLAQPQAPRPLCFASLLFGPLDLLVVAASGWRPNQHTLPETALPPIAEQVRTRLGSVGAAIEAEIVGHTTADAGLIVRLGGSLWPAAAAIIAEAAIPPGWQQAGLGTAHYRQLADTVAALLAETATVEMLCAEAATFLLRPDPGVVRAMLGRIARTDPTALPPMIAVLLDRLPETGEMLNAADSWPEADVWSETVTVRAAVNDAAELLLRQLDQDDRIGARIETGSLADAAGAAGRIAALLKHLQTPHSGKRRHERLRVLRKRLDSACSARFAAGLHAELLAPLERMGIAPASIPALEAAARGLRLLETEARAVGDGAAYDRLLDAAAEAIGDSAMQDRLSRSDQLRLVELLSGPDAALAMLERAG